MSQIIAKLQEYGIRAERKSIYKDIELLREFGLDIEKQNGSPVQYKLASRNLTIEELSFIADAIQSSKFLCENFSNKTVKALKRYCSDQQGKLLDKKLMVSNRAKGKNSEVFLNVDEIQNAIASKCKLSFEYYKYDFNLKLVPNEESWDDDNDDSAAATSIEESERNDEQRKPKRRIVTPIELMYSDGFYYLVCFSDDHQGIRTYRVDRMRAVYKLDERGVRNEQIASFDKKTYATKVFNMFDGEEAVIDFLVKRSVFGAFVDKFGVDNITPTIIDNDTAKVIVKVRKSPTLWGWLSQFGTEIKILDKKVVEEYSDYLKGIIARY